MRGIYIHIPFCHQICHYCDFNKVFFKNQPVDEYIESIGEELAILQEEGNSFDEVETVFLGGGTPTSLSEAQLDRLLEIVNRFVRVKSLKEFTTEANPDELTPGKLAVLHNGGVNRLSIGVQSFDSGLLAKIGRTHGPNDAVRVVGDARKAGFDNISIDLMYGLPGQTIKQWRHTLEQTAALDLPHTSGYSLIVEPKTVFYNLMNKGKLPLPGEDTETEMFEMLIDSMEKQNRKQYEISNFALPGYESLHNLIYWENENYAGIGAGAHGYVKGRRYSNIGPLAKYMNTVSAGGRPVQQEHEVTDAECMEEEMFLGLRKMEGISASVFHRKFGKPLEEIYGAKLERLRADGLMEQQGDHWKLTKKGIFRGNDVFQQFLF
ncbi:radical SAM family heme chaperone HemW [Sporosarcina sp. FSL W7-1349]|uniref:radical SAM family heme chaperone HemW n=1 Tax=Sporosarcina sp. FSL W7-1349 TaxID=2921561 RepID=UPI0030F85F1F